MFCNQLLAILIVTFLFSCQSNTKNVPTSVKKYSEYTDIQKDNLSGDVIGVVNYNYRNNSKCKDCLAVTFYNDKGFKEISFFKNDPFDILYRFIYLNNTLLNSIETFISKLDGTISNSINYFEYDSKMNLITQLSNDDTESTTKFSYDENGFPNEEFTIDRQKKFYWSNEKLDSVIYLINNEIYMREYFKEGRKSEVFIYKDGILDNDESYSCKYILDSFGNDINLTRIFLNGKTESISRKIIYKGGDLSEYFNSYIELEIISNKIKGTKSNMEYSDDFESDNNIQTQPVEKEKIICGKCGGTGQKICDKCYGNGETRCFRCNGTGVANDGRRCIFCSGGYEKCTKCYGKTRLSCDGCASRGYTNY